MNLKELSAKLGLSARYLDERTFASDLRLILATLRRVLPT